MSSALSVLPVPQREAGGATPRTRRQFSAAYKLQILAAAVACTTPGELGALLRREGLYSSHLAFCRAARRVGGPGQAAGTGRDRPDPTQKHIAASERALA